MFINECLVCILFVACRHLLCSCHQCYIFYKIEFIAYIFIEHSNDARNIRNTNKNKSFRYNINFHLFGNKSLLLHAYTIRHQPSAIPYMHYKINVIFFFDFSILDIYTSNYVFAVYTVHILCKQNNVSESFEWKDGEKKRKRRKITMNHSINGSMDPWTYVIIMTQFSIAIALSPSNRNLNF